MSTVKDRTWLASLRVAGLYLVSSALWIALSDEVVNRLASDRDDLTRLQTFKGWGWILVTAFLLHALIRQALRASQAAAERSLMETAQLELVLSQLPGIVWTADKNLTITSSRGGGLTALGQESDATKGMHLGEPVPEGAQREQVLEAAHRALGGEESSYEIEFAGRRLETKMVPLRGSAEEPVGVLGYARDITYEKTLVDRLEQSAAERDKLLKHLVRAEKDERDRIASGIHDDSIQVMTGAAMALDLLLGQLEEEQSRELAERARSSLGEAIKRLRTLVFELKPVELDRYGLAAALRQVPEGFQAVDGFKYEIDDGMIGGLSSHSRYSIFRVAREAIINTHKHAKASMVKVRLHKEDEGIRVVVEDDGCGFDASQTVDRRHFGLGEMKQRAQLAGGWFRVSSDPGAGTRVEFWMPLVEHSEEDQVTV